VKLIGLRQVVIVALLWIPNTKDKQFFLANRQFYRAWRV